MHMLKNFCVYISPYMCCALRPARLSKIGSGGEEGIKNIEVKPNSSWFDYSILVLYIRKKNIFVWAKDSTLVTPDKWTHKDIRGPVGSHQLPVYAFPRSSTTGFDCFLLKKLLIFPARRTTAPVENLTTYFTSPLYFGWRARGYRQFVAVDV